MARRTGILPPNATRTYKKINQVRAGNNWFHRYAMVATPFGSREKAFRHVWNRRGDRRLDIFRFRLTRDDETILDHTQLQPLDGIVIYQDRKDHPGLYDVVGRAHGYDSESWDAANWTLNEEGTFWYYSYGTSPEYTVEFSYEVETRIWTVPFLNWPNLKVRKGRIFWVSFYSEYGATVMRRPPEEPDEHPRYWYRSYNFYQDEGKLRPRFYEVRVPYYTKSVEVLRVPSEDFPDEDTYGYCGSIGSSYFGKCQTTKNGSKIMTVKSSLPYDVSYLTEGSPLGAYYGFHWIHDMPTVDRADVLQYYATTGWYLDEWYWDEEVEDWIANPFIIADWVSAATSNGDTTTNIVTHPISSSEKVVPTPYVAQERAHSISIAYTGPDTYDLIINCKDGPLTFPLVWKIFRANHNITSSINFD